MCGIAGIIKYNQSVPHTEAIRDMTRSFHHRGPDAEGFFCNDDIALGHKRLSIIDLSDCSNQPMADHTGRFVIVFNGEIYNYSQLKQQLSGYPYSTNGDTEVILAAYTKWGSDCVAKLAGMFSFAIWDNQAKQLFLARDRIGVKPLYFCHLKNAFLFSSEIRSLLASQLVPATLEPNAVSEFLQFQSVGFPQSIIKGVKSLEAGSWMKLDSEGLHTEKYFSLFDRPSIIDLNDRDEIKSRLKELLFRAVQHRMVSDVPVAAFLSGGIDSSAIVAIMSELSQSPVNTFTVGFEEKEFDESPYAQIISKKFNTTHQQILLKARNFLDDLIPALDAMDTPTGDGINSFVVAHAIRRNNIKVALSGAGGDELFAGYPIFHQFLRINKLRRIWTPLKPVRQMAGLLMQGKNTHAHRYQQLLSARNTSIASVYPSFRQIISRKMLEECTNFTGDIAYPGNGILFRYEKELMQLPPLSQVSVAEYLGYTQHTLLKDLDQMSMATSLEVREPFFDHELISFVLNIPDRHKLPHYPKQLLVESLGNLLPPEIVHRRKQGFLLPWNNWIKTSLRDFCESHLIAASQRNFIKEKALLSYWKRFLNNDTSIRWMEIWLFVVLEYWLQKNKVNE